MHREVIGNTGFTYRVVDSKDQLSDIFALRYQVYCRECKFIKEEDYPEAKEHDKYDPYSLQFAVEDSKGIIGAARLILSSPLGFPLEEHCGNVLSINKDSLPSKQIAEISRLVISKEYRRRVNDGLFHSPPEEQVEEDSPRSQRIRPMIFGMYREIYQESKRRGVKYWYAVMEPSLWTLLKLNGFLFHPIGEEVDFYGPVRPYLASVEEIENSIRVKFPDVFDTYLLDGLERDFWPELNKKETAGFSEPGLYDIFRDRVKGQPDAPAIYYKTQAGYCFSSYAQLHDEVVRLGNFLYKQGVRELDKVDILLNNSPAWATAFMAIQYLKAIAVPLDTTLVEEELQERVFHCNPKILICDKNNLEKASSLIKEIKKYISVIVVDDAEVSEQIHNSSNQERSGQTLPFKNQAAVYFFTSGTSGPSKVVMLSHRNLISNASGIAKVGSLKTTDSFICLLPFYHSYALMTTCILPLLFGAKITFPPTMNPKDLRECMNLAHVTVLTGVPQIFSVFHHRIKDSLNKLPVLKRLFLRVVMEVSWALRKYLKVNLSGVLLKELHNSFSPNLRVMITGGAHLDKEITLDFFKWGFTLLEGYGLSETSPIVAWNSPGNYRIGSVGKLLPGVQVKLFQLDRQGAGEITIKGPNVMLGYYQNPEITSRSLLGGWFLSGDIGYFDKEGYLYILGRRDELVVLSSGKKVSLEELESHYSLSRYVKEVCVLALTQKGFVEKSKQLVAVVVPNLESFPGGASQESIEQAIRDDFKSFSGDLSEYKRVRGLVISNKPLPRTALGKIMRHKVERQLQSLKKTTQGTIEQQEVDREIAQLPEAEKVLRFLSQRLKRKVNLTDHLEIDLGFDSLARIELLLELQKEFNVTVPDTAAVEFAQARTVQDIIRKLKAFLK
ncbi:MAG: PEP-CTERM/exosortase system-associated acyltransferase [Candidatus Omnitrophica bacterium]|nr:PEP-CTERM/exosortase system-associated acyltransferase [Candidatus Omnitrophota bacterium]